MTSIKWFRKKTSKKILLHASSAHPSAAKRAVVKNMFGTAAGVCTDEALRLESLELASLIAAKNGYATLFSFTP